MSVSVDLPWHDPQSGHVDDVVRLVRVDIRLDPFDLSMPDSHVRGRVETAARIQYSSSDEYEVVAGHLAVDTPPNRRLQ